MGSGEDKGNVCEIKQTAQSQIIYLKDTIGRLVPKLADFQLNTDHFGLKPTTDNTNPFKNSNAYSIEVQRSAVLMLAW